MTITRTCVRRDMVSILVDRAVPAQLLDRSVRRMLARTIGERDVGRGGTSPTNIGCGASETVTLADALGLAANDVVAIVGGAGKVAAMFRLAREMVERVGEPA